MKLLISICVLAILTSHVTFVKGQDDTDDADEDASFQKYLKSFLGNLFGTATTTEAPPQDTDQPPVGNGSIVQPTLPMSPNDNSATLNNATPSNNTALTNDALSANATVQNNTGLNNTTPLNNAAAANGTATSNINGTGINSTQPVAGEASNTPIVEGSPPMNNSHDQILANETLVNSIVAENSTETQPRNDTNLSTTSRPFSSTTSWYYDEEEESENDPTCYRQTSIQDYCSAPSDLTDVSFWDLYAAVFSDSVLDGLIEECIDGEWCLVDKYDYWNSLIVERTDILMNSEIIASVCKPGVVSCIDNMAEVFKNCSFYYLMAFTVETLDLVCNLRFNEDLTDQCYKHVIEALHVTLADKVRQEDGMEPTEVLDTCDSPEAHMTQGLICITNSCPGEGDAFKRFKPWSWFTTIVDDLITECDYNISECTGLLQVGDQASLLSDTFSSTTASTLFITSGSATTAFWQWFSSSFQTSDYSSSSSEESPSVSETWAQSQDNKRPANYVKPEELQMMITISTATMVTAVFLSLTVCLCYRRYRRNAVIKDGYQKLLNEGDES